MKDRHLALPPVRRSASGPAEDVGHALLAAGPRAPRLPDATPCAASPFGNVPNHVTSPVSGTLKTPMLSRAAFDTSTRQHSKRVGFPPHHARHTSPPARVFTAPVVTREDDHRPGLPPRWRVIEALPATCRLPVRRGSARRCSAGIPGFGHAFHRPPARSAPRHLRRWSRRQLVNCCPRSFKMPIRGIMTAVTRGGAGHASCA